MHDSNVHSHRVIYHSHCEQSVWHVQRSAFTTRTDEWSVRSGSGSLSFIISCPPPPPPKGNRLHQFDATYDDAFSSWRCIPSCEGGRGGREEEEEEEEERRRRRRGGRWVSPCLRSTIKPLFFSVCVLITTRAKRETSRELIELVRSVQATAT